MGEVVRGGRHRQHRQDNTKNVMLALKAHSRALVVFCACPKALIDNAVDCFCIQYKHISVSWHVICFTNIVHIVSMLIRNCQKRVKEEEIIAFLS